jgi:hypothetical protein
MSFGAASRAFLVIVAGWAAQLLPAPAVAQERLSDKTNLLLLLKNFVDRCEAFGVDHDTGSQAYYVYAYAVPGTRREPLFGDARSVFSKTEVCIFDAEHDLAAAEKQYRALKQAFRRDGGVTRIRDFPFEDRSWRFDDFASAEKKADQLRRKSCMAYWPGVLKLRVIKNTGKTSYFLFGYRPILVHLEPERDEEDGDMTFTATKEPWELVIFDDEEVAAAAEKLYEGYVRGRASLTDGMGHRVGPIEPYLERFDTYFAARKRAAELRRKLNPFDGGR